VTGGGRRREEAPGIQNQKQEPHTKLWGIKKRWCPSSSSLAKLLYNSNFTRVYGRWINIFDIHIYI
jgi:hypothetical protein